MCLIVFCKWVLCVGCYLLDSGGVHGYLVDMAAWDAGDCSGAAGGRKVVGILPKGGAVRFLDGLDEE